MNTTTKNIYRVLIIEDEVLIADTIRRYVESAGHEVVGSAISYEEGQELFNQADPDLILIDIRLSGEKTGIDLAHYIRTSDNPKPFIYLTAQADSNNIQLAKETFPMGYLSKPLQKKSLIASIEISMHNFLTDKEENPTILLNDGSKSHITPINKIRFLQSEHVYVKVYLDGNVIIIQRSALKELLAQLPNNQFVQTHRSFAVNINKVSNWNAEHVFVEDTKIPISRAKKKSVIETLKQIN